MDSNTKVKSNFKVGDTIFVNVQNGVYNWNEGVTDETIILEGIVNDTDVMFYDYLVKFKEEKHYPREVYYADFTGLSSQLKNKFYAGINSDNIECKKIANTKLAKMINKDNIYKETKGYLYVKNNN